MSMFLEAFFHPIHIICTYCPLQDSGVIAKITEWRGHTANQKKDRSLIEKLNKISSYQF